ncbi:ly6/PLAUR domain-containing protein 6 isoform X2 [Crotalus tigris]|uniref:ly6/PLAUR domain-containing protein 6 isoform X2 n=1 Tax=Crotalus tigris TaxID=88082 RepID=UPI00192FA79D|nr:ly6/PLAUR domain-containing protein 6 isoform X2 [Crotalus tigris]
MKCWVVHQSFWSGACPLEKPKRLLSHYCSWTESPLGYVAATPYPGGFKCFTCEQAVDNYECNQWAPDVYCPRATRYCYSQHTLEANGKSVSVTKRCVPLEDCLTTGCIALQHKGLKVCTSCCEGNICNLTLPRNSSDAIFSTTTPINHTQRHWQDASIIMLGLLSLFAT